MCTYMPAATARELMPGVVENLGFVAADPPGRVAPDQHDDDNSLGDHRPLDERRQSRIRMLVSILHRPARESPGSRAQSSLARRCRRAELEVRHRIAFNSWNRAPADGPSTKCRLLRAGRAMPRTRQLGDAGVDDSVGIFDRDAETARCQPHFAHVGATAERLQQGGGGERRRSLGRRRLQLAANVGRELIGDRTDDDLQRLRRRTHDAARAELLAARLRRRTPGRRRPVAAASCTRRPTRGCALRRARGPTPCARRTLRRQCCAGAASSASRPGVFRSSRTMKKRNRP